MVEEQSDLLMIQEKSYRQGEKLEAIRQRLEALEGFFFYLYFKTSVLSFFSFKIVEKANLLQEVLKEKLKQRDNNANNKMLMRRQQSAAFKRLNPVFDYEMNYSEFQSSLQQVNNNLLNKKELDYIYHVR